MTPEGTQDAEKYLVTNNVHNFKKSKVEKGNFQSIYYSNLDTFTNKKAEIIDIVNNESPDIIVFTELLNKKNPVLTKAELKINGYDEFFRDDDINDKVNKRRGVIIYTKKALNAKGFEGFDNYNFKEHMWCTYKTKNNENIIIGGIYRSGSSDDVNNDNLLDIFKSEVFDSFDRAFICGDFNYPTVRWDGTWSNDNNESFCEAVRDGFFTQHINKPTRHREGQHSNILDLVFTRDEGDINDILYCTPLGKSDHVLLKIITSIPTTKDRVEDSYRYVWEKGEYDKMREHMYNIDWNEIKNLDTENCWLFIKSEIQEAIKLYIPVIKCPSTVKEKPPWMNLSIKKSIKKKYKLFKRFIESDSVHSLEYREYIKTRNEVSKAIKTAKMSHEKSVASQSKSNPKAFWKYINSFRKCRENMAALLREDNTLATDDKEKADLLIQFFSSVLTIEDTTNIPVIPPGSRSNGEFVYDIVIEEEQVQRKLNNLNPNKSPGPDKIFPRVLKELSEELAKPLTILFNKSFQEGKLPCDWKLAEITAIFKKGNRMSSNNYRPVSLTCVICKLMESFVRDAVQNHMEQYKLYCRCQHGFRKGKSCITQLLEVMNDFSNYINDDEAFDVIYLDFKKAFDSVPHERLLVKLRSYGIDGNLFKWIKDFLSQRFQYVKVGKETSSTMGVTSGIPQGSILGPILFLIFINDLPDCVNSTCSIFADDTKIYNTCENNSTIQNDINALQDWSHKWQLYFNCTKCKCIHFGKNNPCNDYYFHNEEDNQSIPKCTEEKDLGVTFDNSLKFDLHIDAIVRKANSMIEIIKRNFTFINKEIFLKLYKAMIRPHLEYGQIIWSPHLIRQSKKIENVQRRATKIVPSLKDLPYDKRLKTLKLPTLKYRRIRGDMINVYKLLSNNDHDCPLLPLHKSRYSTRGHNKKLQKNSHNCNFMKFSFSRRVTNLWNSLNNVTTNAETTNKFKKLLDEEIRKRKYQFD